MKLHLSVLALCLILLFPSCKKKSVLDQNIEDYIRKNAHNPESYEPVSTTPIDTITEIEFVQEKIKEKLSSIETVSSHVERNLSMLKTDSSSVEVHKSISERHSKSKYNFYSAVDSTELASAINDLDYWSKELATSQEDLCKAKDELNRLNSRLDSIQKQSNPDNIYRYHFLHQFNGRIPLGGMMLKNAFIETDKDYNILTFTEQ